MEEKDTIIVTNAKKQNNGRMLVHDEHSENYTATDAEDKKTFKKLHDALENGVND